MFMPLSTLSQISPGQPFKHSRLSAMLPLCQSLARCACSSQRCASAGYFDAPGADVAPLKSLQSAPPILPDITLVFCCIEKLKDMKVGALSPHYGHPCHMACEQYVKHAR